VGPTLNLSCGGPTVASAGRQPLLVYFRVGERLKRSAGPFEILEILGEGSFGTVCVARVETDPLRRRVALKILKGAYAQNKKIVKRIRDEARLMSAISHPSIVRVERLMEINGRPVVVMEHVQGVSLDQLLLRFKSGLPAAVTIEVLRQSCLALHAAYAEAAGEDGSPLRVIHRDIKPSNIMLSVHGEVKVLDFGIARGEFEGREARTESVVMGSRPYMAPERLDGVSDTPAVDVYSAGMTMYELLAGRPMGLSINPVSHDQAMNRQLQYIQVPGMSAAAMEDLRDLVRRMCAYNRDYRPSAVECSRDLEQLLYAIDRRYHINIEEFARSTVLPIYEARQRTTPEDSGQQQEEPDEFLREVTGAITSHTPRPQRPAANTPYIFVGVLAVLVMGLAVLAALKWVQDNGRLPGIGDVAAQGFPSGPGEDPGLLVGGPTPRVRVEVWFPSEASGQLGDVVLQSRGPARIAPGPSRLDLKFDDGGEVQCRFLAAEGTTIRWVGNDQISVDDGDAVTCHRQR
jgi:serine/threonine protein kinase